MSKDNLPDKVWDLNKKFGRKINAEKKRYLTGRTSKDLVSFTNIRPDEYTGLGIAKPLLKICDPERDKDYIEPIKYGRRRLTAVYTDIRGKIYKSSLARTWLIYGRKCYVHCPNIYHPIGKKDITFTANLFSNNRPVPGGNSKFKYKDKTVSKSKLWVTNGYVEETHTLKPHNLSWYSCHYEGSEHYHISEGEDTGYIFTYKEYKTPLVVDVPRIIMNENEKGKLIARVYHREHESVVDIPDDVPRSGTIQFYIDNEKYGDPVPIQPNGIATIPYTATHGVGVHLITAVYEPDTDEMKKKYQTTSGSNTLFIGNDKNRPIFTQLDNNCGKKGDNHTFKFKTDRAMDGYVRIFIDGIAVQAKETKHNGEITMLGNTQPLFEQYVKLKKDETFTFEFRIPNSKTDTTGYRVWGHSGYHNMIIQYIIPDEEHGDMEYWYFWDDFYIQVETVVTIDSELDNTSDGGVFTGNQMYIHENNETVHYKPSTKVIPKSFVVGSPMRIKVTDSDGNEIVKAGKVTVNVKTRKKEHWVN